MALNYISAAEAASLIKHGYNIGFVGYFAIVHGFAEVGVGGIGRAVADGLDAREHTVARVSGRSTGEDTYLERVSFCMFCFRDFC